MSCPECGAPGCEAHYHACLVKEFSDPAYGAVHHLTVAAYMLQHSSQLTRDGWRYGRELLREFLVENKAPELVRRQNRSAVDNGRRTWKIADKGGAPKIEHTRWSRTVLDVRLGSAEVYCTDVTAWARAILIEAESAAWIDR